MIVAELHGVATAARVTVEKLVASPHSEISTHTANQSSCRLHPVLFNARLPLLLLLTFRPLLSNPYPHRAYRPSCWRKRHTLSFSPSFCSLAPTFASVSSSKHPHTHTPSLRLSFDLAHSGSGSGSGSVRLKSITGRCHSHYNERAPWRGRRRKNYRCGKSSCRRDFHIQG